MGDIVFGICVVLAGLLMLAVTVWTVGGVTEIAAAPSVKS